MTSAVQDNTRSLPANRLADKHAAFSFGSVGHEVGVIFWEMTSNVGALMNNRALCSDRTIKNGKDSIRLDKATPAPSTTSKDGRAQHSRVLDERNKLR